MKANTTISLRSGKRPKPSKSSTKSSRKSSSPESAEDIARRADEGEDVAQFFTNRGRMMAPIQRVNVDFTAPMLAELDDAAQDLNVSRQAVIKTMLRQALDQRYLAVTSRSLPKRA